MTRSKIKGITVKAVEVEEGTADLCHWTIKAVPKENEENPFGGTICALFHTDTYKCWYGSGDTDYYTPEVKINHGEEHEFEMKLLKAPASYPFSSGVSAGHKVPGGFQWDSALYIYSNSADQEAGKTGVPWIWDAERVYKAAEGSSQTVNWEIKNYGADAYIYVELWDNTEGKILDKTKDRVWVKANDTYSDTFTFTFHSGHTLWINPCYWYNDGLHLYELFAWATK